MGGLPPSDLKTLGFSEEAVAEWISKADGHSGRLILEIRVREIAPTKQESRGGQKGMDELARISIGNRRTPASPSAEAKRARGR